MARRPSASAARSGRATPIVLLLLLAIAAMAYYAVVPDVRAARDAIRIELAARAAAECDEAAREYVAEAFVAGVDEVSLDMVDAYRRTAKRPPLVWPPEADLSTLDFSDTNGVSVVVLLSGGPRRVTAADLAAAE
jgi:hypothetical protein